MKASALKGLLVLVVLGLGWFSCAEGSPADAVSVRSREFYVPAPLRKRVDFWINVFTKYGKYQVVVHHRRYPWVIFEIFDFSAQAPRLSAAGLDVHRNRVLKQYLRELEIGLRALAAGRAPSDALQRRIASVMRGVPGGRHKYRLALNQDLIRTQTGIKEKWVEALKRSGRYIHIMEDIFRSYRLPAELTRLPFIESSFDYYVKSSAGAVGLWQFMPRTGKQYLTINYLVDERRDVIASTRAAARYLEAAYRSLGSWPLAITSYNNGVGGVLRKVRQTGSDNIAVLIEEKDVFGFASGNFYPEFLAALEVYDRYQTYFPGLKLDPPVDVMEVTLPHATGIFYLCRQLGVNKAVLQDLNHALSSAVWEGRFKIPKGYNLKLPRAYVSKLDALRIPEPVGPTASSVYGGLEYQVRRGDTLIKIAKKYGISVKQLMQLNDLSSTVVKMGQRLIIKPPEGSRRYDPPAHEIAVPAAGKSAAVNKSRSYRVAKGDSLWSISRKFKVKVEALKKANSIGGTSIKPGQSLIIPK